MATRSWSWSPRWFAPVVLTLAIVGAQSAAASGPPEPSNGTFGRTGPPAAVAVRTADGNTILTLTARPGRFTGTFTGAYSEDLRIVRHADGSFNFAAEVTCLCTVDGMTGTMTVKLDGTGTPAGTTFESGLAIRFGDTGSRQFLTSGLIGSSGALPNPTVSGSATSGTSAFSFGGLDFVLSQVLSPRFDVSANRIGSRLTQTYTINNPGASTASFELIRYLDGDLEFDNMISDGGGRFLVNGVETLFETDTAQNVADPTTFVGISAPDGNAPAVGRYQISVFTGSSGNCTRSGEVRWRASWRMRSWRDSWDSRRNRRLGPGGSSWM